MFGAALCCAVLRSLHALASAARIDLYDVLDVPTSASQRELKRAYRKQARALHPDKHPKERKAEFEAKFIALANAYEILSDPKTRAAYDLNPSSYFEQESNHNSGYSDFESAFKRHGFDGGNTVEDTPLNRIVVVLMILTLAAPVAYVSFHKLIAKRNGNASRAQLLQSLQPKSKEEQQRQKDAERREARRRQQRREERNTVRRRAKERSEEEMSRVKKADIKAVVKAPAADLKKGMTTDAAPGAARRAMTGHRIIKGPDDAWAEKEDALLLVACKKYPGGTPQRWEKIASYVGRDRPAVLKRVKALKIRLVRKTDIDFHRAQNSTASAVSSRGASFRQTPTDIDAGQREWTQDEQSRLENALKTVPSSLPKLERWTQISQIVKTRTKGECARRFKELRKMLRKNQSK
eukprot:g1751.t1